MMAQTTYSQIATVRQQEMAHRKDVETQRQGLERGNLEEAYRIERERFEEEWTQKMEAVEVRAYDTSHSVQRDYSRGTRSHGLSRTRPCALPRQARCRLKLVELAELHEIGRDNLERDITAKIKGAHGLASWASRIRLGGTGCGVRGVRARCVPELACLCWAGMRYKNSSHLLGLEVRTTARASPGRGLLLPLDHPAPVSVETASEGLLHRGAATRRTRAPTTHHTTAPYNGTIQCRMSSAGSRSPRSLVRRSRWRRARGGRGRSRRRRTSARWRRKGGSPART